MQNYNPSSANFPTTIQLPQDGVDKRNVSTFRPGIEAALDMATTLKEGVVVFNGAKKFAGGIQRAVALGQNNTGDKFFNVHEICDMGVAFAGDIVLKLKETGPVPPDGAIMYFVRVRNVNGFKADIISEDLSVLCTFPASTKCTCACYFDLNGGGHWRILNFSPGVTVA